MLCGAALPCAVLTSVRCAFLCCADLRMLYSAVLSRAVLCCAVCCSTFGADAATCGHPFCDRMILSFQGGVFAMIAYAKAGAQPPQYDVDDPDWQGCFPTGTIVDNTRKAGALEKAVRSTGLLQKLQARAAQRAASSKAAARAKREPAGEVGPSWEEGLAVVVTGPVTVTSLKHRVEYDSGMLQYVPSWIGVPLVEGEPGRTAMVVTPYTYDISLSKDGGGHGDAYDEHYKYVM